MKLDDHPQYKKEDRAATREQEIMEGILKRAADKAKSEYGKYQKFGKASGEAVDRLQRMNQHKQDKYGPSTFKQRMKSGAEHNTDNEKKAKEGK
jgi:type IV secretory pathway TrbL component